ncbi:hypothetical protein BHUM_06193c [Candidatus Burkholderia humilis]|nr:hypothetical protein BHUM_06193c [Candidatus Burkholderia humilis]
MTHATPSPKSTPKADDDKDAPLPHESDQSVESQNDHEPRDVGKQAHEDLKRGLVDTDRRGGEYQDQTQRDEHANINSDSKP